MKLLLCVLAIAILTSCGSATRDADPSPQGPPAAPDPAWDTVKPAVARACGGCHDGAKHPLDFHKKAVLLGVRAKAKARIEAGTMPPAGSLITTADKEAILNYL